MELISICLKDKVCATFANIPNQLFPGNNIADELNKRVVITLEPDISCSRVKRQICASHFKIKSRRNSDRKLKLLGHFWNQGNRRFEECVGLRQTQINERHLSGQDVQVEPVEDAVQGGNGDERIRSTSSNKSGRLARMSARSDDPISLRCQTVHELNEEH